MHSIPLTIDEHEVTLRCLHRILILSSLSCSYSLNCPSLKCRCKRFESSIVEMPVTSRRLPHQPCLSSLLSPLVTHLQTAFVEFNTVQEAEDWMNLTQVQTKHLTIPLFSFLSIGGNVVYFTTDGRRRIDRPIYLHMTKSVDNLVGTLDSTRAVHFHSGYISSQRTCRYLDASTRRRWRRRRRRRLLRSKQRE